ncbi:MAG: hypothetical protein HOC71_08550, partial [Candidatus Latescibacteria bacterium]|nr:hypothetical protein [Candidatus Latescibacterota bacterium]
MIVDIHTHFWDFSDIASSAIANAENAGGVKVRFNITSDMHLEETKATGKSVVFGLRGKGINIPNDMVKAQVDIAPDRLIFFTSVN